MTSFFFFCVCMGWGGGGAYDLSTINCALEGSELFGSTKWKRDLPPGADYSHINLTKGITQFLTLRVVLKGHAWRSL